MSHFFCTGFWRRWMNGLLLAGLCFSLLNTGLAADAARITIPQPDFQAFFDTRLNQQMIEEHIAGATVAVVQNGNIVFAKGYGYADLAMETPVKADQTLFFIGSDGKLFTWTAVMQLVGQGKLDLHADINTYLDFEIPATFSEPITLHHLMTHTAGFEEQYNTLLLDDSRSILPLREHLIRYMPARVYPPGKISAYSNYGTALAGYIVERISGLSYEKYLAEYLLKPLGMAHSFVGNVLPPEMAADLSTGYQYENGGYVPLDFEWTAAVPTAPLRTTVTDLSRFMIAHLNGGCVNGSCILPADMLDLMHRSQFTHHPQMADGMAYGFLDMTINGQRVLWHMGESARFITILALIPEQNLGLVVSYNTPPAEGDDILFQFMDAFFPVNRPPLHQPILSGWEERAARFSGIYAPARSAFTTPQVLTRYAVTLPVILDQGRLSFAGWSFIETEPGLFHQADGDRMLALQEDAQGQRWLFVGPLAYFQVRWYQTPGFLLAVFTASLLIFLSAWVVGLIVAIRRGKAHSGAERAAWWVAGSLGLFDTGLLIGLVPVMLTLADRYVFHQETVTVLVGLSWLAVPWTLIVLGFSTRTWLRREWTISRRIHYSLVAFTAVAFLWLLWSLNLMGGLQ